VYLHSFFNLGARWGWVVNATLRPLYARERDPVPIVQEVGWASGPAYTGALNLAPTGIRSPDRPARSESLHRPSYPGPQMHVTNVITRGTEMISHFVTLSEYPSIQNVTTFCTNPNIVFYFFRKQLHRSSGHLTGSALPHFLLTRDQYRYTELRTHGACRQGYVLV